MTRVPTEQDFAALAPDLHVALHFPDPPASTTAILLLFHGLGDCESPFAAFARAMRLPGVLAVAVRGPSVVPSMMVDDEDDLEALSGTGPSHFHWGDDLQLQGSRLDPDPGFTRALRLVGDRLIRDVLVGRCGWRHDDLLLFGFGQGGTFALALAADSRFKGVITIGADIPSAVSMRAAGPANASPMLLCGAADSEAVSSETVQLLRRRFSSVQAVRWTRRADDNGMPRNRAEMTPIMQFLLPKLTAW